MGDYKSQEGSNRTHQVPALAAPVASRAWIPAFAGKTSGSLITTSAPERRKGGHDYLSAGKTKGSFTPSVFEGYGFLCAIGPGEATENHARRQARAAGVVVVEEPANHLAGGI